MGERPGDPMRSRATIAATRAVTHACCGDRDASIACAQTAEALYGLATTQDLLAEALRAGLEECERLRESLGWANTHLSMERDATDAILEQRDAALAEVERLRARVEEAERERDGAIGNQNLARQQRWECERALEATMTRISEALSPRMSWGVCYSRDETVARIAAMHAEAERLRTELAAERATTALLRETLTRVLSAVRSSRDLGVVNAEPIDPATIAWERSCGRPADVGLQVTEASMKYTPPRYDEVFFAGAAAPEANIAPIEPPTCPPWHREPDDDPQAHQSCPWCSGAGTASTIEEAAEALRTELQSSYPGVFVGHDEGALNVYVGQRLSRVLVTDEFSGFVVRWHFGVSVPPAKVPHG